MCKSIFATVSDTKDPNKCKIVDATRIKRYTSYYIRQNRPGPLLDFIANAKAPIEHLFNDHTWCSSSWCWLFLISILYKSTLAASIETTVMSHPPPYSSNPSAKVIFDTSDDDSMSYNSNES